MPGPPQPWDQPEDPRDQTVDMPRIDLAGFGTGHPAPENGPRSSRHLGDQSRTLPPRPGVPPPPPAGRRQPICRRTSARRIAPPRAGCPGGTLAFIRGRLRARPRRRRTGHRSRPNRCRAAGRTQAAIRMPAVIRTPSRPATTANRGACSGRRRQRTATGSRLAIVVRSKQTPATAWAATARPAPGLGRDSAVHPAITSQLPSLSTQRPAGRGRSRQTGQRGPEGQPREPVRQRTLSQHDVAGEQRISGEPGLLGQPGSFGPSGPAGQHGTAQHDTVQHGATEHSAAKHSAAKHHAVSSGCRADRPS